jgi:hypothetical protein
MMRIVNIFLVILLFTSCVPRPVPTLYGKPRHVRAMFKHDPATSVVIGWSRFKSQLSKERIYWDTVDHGTDVEAYANSMEPQKRTNYFGVHSGFVELKNLQPETRYYFVIENSWGLSKRYYVDTLADHRGAKLSIIAGGDSRNNRGTRRAANLLVAKLKPHLVLFGGDMTNVSSPGEWFDWLSDWEDTIGEDGRITPVVAARGNHEYSNEVLEKILWLPKYNYYALTLAGGLIRTYVLNSEISVAGNQLTWLKDDLENNQDVIWKMAQYHKPIRPHVAKKKEGTAMYKYWAPLFYEYEVDLVVESDSHTVKNTWPIRPDTGETSDEGFVRDDENGTVYVGEGCWGAPLRAANDNKEWTRDSGSFNQFKWIFVDADKIELRTVKVDNAQEVDELDLADRFSMPNNLEVWTPESGEVVTIQ